MTPEERDALITYVSEAEGFAKLYAKQVERLKYLLLTKGIITKEELEDVVKTVEARFAVEEATDPRFEALSQLQKRIEDQK